MNFLKRVIAKLHRKSMRGHTFNDVMSMYGNGAYKDAYAALCNMMDNESQLSKDGDIYILWAELELLANDNAYKALELLNKAFEVGYSEMGYYYKVRGDVLFDKGNYDEAIQNFEKSISFEPNVATLIMLAQALSKINDCRATDVWEQILEKDPQNCLSHAYVGLEAVKSCNRSKAMLMAKRAEKLNPSSPEELFTIGLLYYDLDEYGMAINSYLKANKLGYKDKGFLYACIAACYLSMNQAVPARKYAQWAVGCNPENDYVNDVWHEYEERFGSTDG